MSHYGKQPYGNLRYCIRCCMPETSEGITFDKMGMCRGCQSSEHKMHINWVERKKESQKIKMMTLTFFTAAQQKEHFFSDYDDAPTPVTCIP